MTPARSPRWLMSFADLCLLLLGFFVLLHARADGSAAAASVRAAFGGPAGSARSLDFAAADLFEPGEAVLRPAYAQRLEQFGRQIAPSHGRVRIESRGSDRATSRFDAWELAAARAAAVGRAVAAGGVSPERIDITLPQGRPTTGPQRLLINGA